MNQNQLKKLYSDVTILVIILIVSITIGLLVYKNKIKDINIQELKRKSYANDIRDSVIIDSLKFKMLQDSLYIVDIQRVNSINQINKEDGKDKGNRDIVIAIIPNANDEQRDRIWAAYSPKN
jgi:hypothetical protein